MKFSKDKFRRNAPHAIRKALPESHRDVLDGMEVTRDTLEYQVDGEEYYLFLVYAEWCEVEK
ncbi:hypothetical protein [Muricomes intestini]|jgi:hypothetical protein|uniref:hypothetical protein n=1 Tax=Muricomes intestini TaxID=1796634 RepID=UPI002FDE4444